MDSIKAFFEGAISSPSTEQYSTRPWVVLHCCLMENGGESVRTVVLLYMSLIASVSMVAASNGLVAVRSDILDGTFWM